MQLLHYIVKCKNFGMTLLCLFLYNMLGFASKIVPIYAYCLDFIQNYKNP